MHANKREEIKEVWAGDIVAVGRAQGRHHRRHHLRPRATRSSSSRSSFPEPVISIAIEPKTKADQEKLGVALTKLQQEDPTFRVHTDQETGQTLISGMGELHLEIIVDRLLREFGSAPTSAGPRWPTRRRSRVEAEGEGRFVRQTGGRGQYGHCKIRDPAESRRATSCSTTRSSAGSIPKEFIKPVADGIAEAMETGPLAGYPLVRHRGRPLRRQLPRGRLLRDRLQDRRLDGLPGRLPRAPARCCSSR